MGVFDYPKSKPAMDRLPAEIIDDLLSTYITPALKERGFKKSGRTYARTKQTWEEIINFQANKWNNRGEGSFTANVGVFHRPTSDADMGRFSPKQPHEYDCQVRQRIGLLFDDPQDTWWEFDRDTDLAALGQTVQTAVLGSALEYLAEFKTVGDILAECEKQTPVIKEGYYPPSLAALAYYAGDEAKALAYLETGKTYRQPTNGSVWRRSYDMAQKLGLPFDPPPGEHHFVLHVVAGDETDAKTGAKLMQQVRLMIDEGWRPNDPYYLHDFEYVHPDYKIHIYGPDEARLREMADKTLKFAAKKFKTAELLALD